MSTPRIRISTPTGVLEAVPALLGYYPTESLVGLFLEHTPTGLICTVGARMNLPGNPTDTADLLASVTDTLNRHAAVIFVIYSADQEQARTVMRTVLTHTDPGKVTLAILASLNGWTTVDPDRPDMIQWTNPYPGSPGTITAQFAAAGLYPTGTRDDLTDSIQAPDTETAADYALARSLDPVPDQPSDAELQAMATDVHRWISSYLAQPATIVPEDAAYLAARIRFPGPRDELVYLLDTTTGPALAAMWQAVAGMTPDEDALPVLACLALSAWVGGDGTLANVAAERAQRLPDGPGASLLRLVESILSGIPPTVWADLKRDL